MGENEQQEIVLGNKQLLSIFFLVVAMMGVAFTIGYIIGRNTAGVGAAAPAQTASAPRSDVTPPPVKSEPDPGPSTAPAPDSSKPDDNQPASAARTSRTQPAKPYETAAAKTPPQEEPPAGASGAGDPPADTTSAKAAPVSAIAAGTYLQVAAVKRQDGDHLVETLRKRGFPALLGESPKEGLFRVLVGPFADMATLADSKQKLRAAGFEPVVAK